jgi:hypothetical protein
MENESNRLGENMIDSYILMMIAVSVQYLSPFLMIFITKYNVIDKTFYRLVSLGFALAIPLTVLYFPTQSGVLGIGAFSGIVAFYPFFACLWSIILPKKYSYTVSFALIFLLGSFLADAHEWFGQIMGALRIPINGVAYLIDPFTGFIIQTFCVVIFYAVLQIVKIKLNRIDYAALLIAMFSIPPIYWLVPTLDYILTPISYIMGFVTRLVWWSAITFVLMRDRA